MIKHFIFKRFQLITELSHIGGFMKRMLLIVLALVTMLNLVFIIQKEASKKRALNQNDSNLLDNKPSIEVPKLVESTFDDALSSITKDELEFDKRRI